MTDARLKYTPLLATLFPRRHEGVLELRAIDRATGRVEQRFIRQLWHYRAYDYVDEWRETHDIYLSMLPRSREEGTRSACLPGRAVWVDLDTPEATIELVAFALAPSLVVSTGTPGHHHAYWELREPADPDWIETVNRRLARRLGGDSNCCDAARVMRLPGTLNHKHDPPVEAQIVATGGPTYGYTVEQIEQALGPDDDKPADPGGGAPPRDPSGPVSNVLTRLDVEGETSSGWMAHCPAHGDRIASLSVAKGDDGRCLLHCFAGCQTEDVVAAIGLTVADLFPLPQPSGARSMAALMVDLADQAGIDLCHDPLEQALAIVPVDHHREVWPVDSTKLRRWLRYQLRAHSGQVAGTQAVNDAIEILAAEALFDGPQRDVYVRVANVDEAVYIDVGDPQWRAVEVRAGNWQIVNNAPVLFLRRASTQPLPLPHAGGSIEDLRELINVPDDASWRLLVAFLVCALTGVGPFPLLVLQGEQGSAKSTTAKMLRRLVDPAKAPLRAGAPDERDLMIAATGQWLVGFDNVSRLSDRLSDALCQLSTGAGFATRRLWTDSEEIIFEAMRPAILNGIAGISQRGDFLSRALVLELPAIPEHERHPEGELWNRFEHAQPHIFGALLDVAADALGRLPKIAMPHTPRLADFARLGTAVEQSCGWSPGSFLEAMERSQAGGLQDVLDAEPVAQVLQGLVDSVAAPWEGTMTDLLGLLTLRAGDEVVRRQTWPKTASHLGARLKRITPALRQIGVHVSTGTTGRDKGKRRSVRLEFETRRGDGGDGGDETADNSERPSGAQAIVRGKFA